MKVHLPIPNTILVGFPASPNGRGFSEEVKEERPSKRQKGPKGPRSVRLRHLLLRCAEAGKALPEDPMARRKKQQKIRHLELDMYFWIILDNSLGFDGICRTLGLQGFKDVVGCNIILITSYN